MTSIPVSEREFQRTVINLAKARGWKVAHFGASVKVVGKDRRFVGDVDSAGFPDLILCRGKELIFAELKINNGKVRPNQKEWLDSLRETGATTLVWMPRHWEEIEETLK